MPDSAASDLSILVPVYNGGDYLRAALESAVAQTVQPFELVIVDDASTDGTPALIEKYSKLPWVRTYRNEKNLGGVGNFIHCTSLAKGRYFTVLNADDLLEPTYVERITAATRAHPDAVLVVTNYYVIDAAGHTSGRARIPPGALPEGRMDGATFVRHLLTKGQSNVVSATAVQLDAYRAAGGTDRRLDTLHDFESYLRVAARGPVVYLSEPQASVRYHDAQWSHRTSHHDDGSTTALFEKIGGFNFLTEQEKRDYIGGLCDFLRRFVFRWARKPGVTLAELRAVRDHVRKTIDGWAASGLPQAAYVRKRSPVLRHRIAWALASSTPGLWLLRQACRRLPV